MIKIFARIRKPSLRWGLLFGILLGIVGIGYNFVISIVTDANTQSILGYIMAFVFIIVGFYAGLRASQESGKWVSGLAAGIWVAIFGTVIFSIIPLVSTLLNVQAIVASTRLYLQTHPESGIKPSDYSASDVITLELISLLAQMIFCALFTTVSGGLGGFVGRRRALAAAVQQADDAPAIVDETVAEAPVVEAPAEVQENDLAEVKDEATK